MPPPALHAHVRWMHSGGRPSNQISCGPSPVLSTLTTPGANATRGTVSTPGAVRAGKRLTLERVLVGTHLTVRAGTHLTLERVLVATHLTTGAVQAGTRLTSGRILAGTRDRGDRPLESSPRRMEEGLCRRLMCMTCVGRTPVLRRLGAGLQVRSVEVWLTLCGHCQGAGKRHVVWK